MLAEIPVVELLTQDPGRSRSSLNITSRSLLLFQTNFPHFSTAQTLYIPLGTYMQKIEGGDRGKSDNMFEL